MIKKEVKNWWDNNSFTFSKGERVSNNSRKIKRFKIFRKS